MLRSRGRDHHRRHCDPRVPGPGPDLADGQVELVAALVAEMDRAEAGGRDALFNLDHAGRCARGVGGEAKAVQIETGPGQRSPGPCSVTVQSATEVQRKRLTSTV